MLAVAPPGAGAAVAGAGARAASLPPLGLAGRPRRPRPSWIGAGV
uniref:Uncharacterized protein n=1 Tax=Arundo donax TaxID=35708 RepID=A0A0A9GJL3_ARUDO